MSYNGPKPPPRVKSVLDDAKLRLTAEPIGNSKGRPSLAIYLNGFDVKVEVWTQADGDKDNGRIDVKLDVASLFYLFQAINEVVAMPDGTKHVESIDWKDYDFQGGKRSDQPVIKGRVAVGRDEDGGIYLSVISKDSSRPKPKFYFGARYFYEFTRAGTPFSKGDIARRLALAYVDQIRTLLPVAVPEQYVIALRRQEEAKRKREEKQNGGGYNNNRGNGGGNSGGGYNNAPAASDFGDDSSLPF